MDLGQFRTARVWLGDLPDAECQVVDKKRASYNATTIATKELQVAAVEIFLPLGGRFGYGLLGGTLIPGTSGSCEVEVCIARNTDRAFPTTLVKKADDIFVGLPSEYAGGILNSIKTLSDKGTLPSGRLSLNRSAHGLTSSSVGLFSQLTTTLMAIFRLNVPTVSDEQLSAAFPKNFF